MERLNKDELFSIAIQLDFKSLINLCMINKRIYQKIYENDSIWFAKLHHDFPNYEELELEINIVEIYKLIYFLQNNCNTRRFLEMYKNKVLDLSHNKLKHIPKEITILKKIESFYLSNNKITEIPDLSDLSNLQRINLYNNRLKILPKEIGNLINLEELDLSNNLLEEIPKEIGNLSNLKELFLQHNLLKEIPQEIGKLSNLHRLFLNGNKLKTIPKEIGSILKFKVLYIRNESMLLPKEITSNKNIQIII